MSMEIINGIEIEKRSFNPEFYLGRNTVIFGGSGSGKTEFTKSILYHLANLKQIPVAICFDKSGNQSFSGFIPDAFIHDTLDPEQLKEIEKIQSDKMDLYRAAQNYEDCYHLYKKYASKSSVDARLQQIEQMTNQMLGKLEASLRPQALSMSNKTRLETIHRALVSWHHDNKNAKLSENELRIILGAEMNPNILLLFDDCGNDMTEKSVKAFFRDMFSKGRHYKITSFTLLQNDTQIEKRARDNAHCYFWTDAISASTSAGSSRGIMGQEIRLKVLKLIEGGFFDKSTGIYRMLGLDKTATKLFFIESKKSPITRIGDEEYWNLARKLEIASKDKKGNENRLLQMAMSS